MRAGLLRHRVAIQSASNSRDGFGSRSQSWSTVRTVWGSVQPVSGSEPVRAQIVSPETTHIVRLRAKGVTITPAMRLQHKSRTLEILSINNMDERNITYEITCKEAI